MSSNGTHQLQIEKRINAPIEKVWQAITDPEMIAKWMTPNGFKSTFGDYKIHLGGRYRAGMKKPETEQYVVTGEYINIVEPQLLEFTHAWEDKNNTPGETTRITIHLMPVDQQTSLVFRQQDFSTKERALGHEQGWNECLEKLENLLSEDSIADPEYRNTRTVEIELSLNAHISEVWRMWTEPALVMKWWGPNDYECSDCQIDFKVDGKYLICLHHQSDQKFYSTGNYKEIVPGKKIVFTDSFSDQYGNIVSPSEHGLTNHPLESLVSVEFFDNSATTVIKLTHSGITDEKILQNIQQAWLESIEKLNTILGQKY